MDNISLAFDPVLARTTKEPTGFLDPAGLDVAYDTTNRTVTLTHASGRVEFMIRRKLYSFASPWTVPTVLGGATPIAHTNANGGYFLKVDADTLAISFDTNAWGFDDLQIAFAYKSASAQFGIRECHGLMQWEGHEELHYALRTYIRSATIPTSGSYVPSGGVGYSTSDSNQNRPGIDAQIVYDEDLSSTIPAYPDNGPYMIGYRAGADFAFAAGELDIFTVSGGGIIQYNPSPFAALAEVGLNDYVNVLTMHLPVTSDAASQAFRTIFVLGQRTHTTLAAAAAESPSQWDFGNLTSSVAEFATVLTWQFQRSATVTKRGVARLMQDPVRWVGTRSNTVGVGGLSPTDHQSLSNRGTMLDPTTYKHPASDIEANTGGAFTGFLTGVVTVAAALALLDAYASASNAGVVSTAAQTFAGAKTFTSGILAPHLSADTTSGGVSIRNKDGTPVLTCGAGSSSSLTASFADGISLAGCVNFTADIAASANTICRTASGTININNGSVIATTANVSIVGGALEFAGDGTAAANKIVRTATGVLNFLNSVLVVSATAAAGNIGYISSVMRIGGAAAASSGSLDAGATPVLSWGNASVTIAQPTTVNALLSTTGGFKVTGGSPSAVSTIAQDANYGMYFASTASPGTDIFTWEGGGKGVVARIDKDAEVTLGATTPIANSFFTSYSQYHRLTTGSLNSATDTQFELLNTNTAADSLALLVISAKNGDVRAKVRAINTATPKIEFGSYSNHAVDFVYNNTSVAGGYSTAGAWTFPINTVHTFGSTGAADGSTAIVIQAKGANDSRLLFNPGSTNIGAIDVNTASGILSFRVNGNEKSRMDSTGAWTLGPASGSADVLHEVLGYDGSSSLVATFKQRRLTNYGLIKVGGSSSQLSFGMDGGRTICTGINETAADTDNKAVYIGDNNILNTNTSIAISKANIQPVTTSMLSEISNITVSTFQRRLHDGDGYTNTLSKFIELGMIADEIQQKCPTLAHTCLFNDSNGNLLGIHMDRMAAVCIKAIQELNEKLDAYIGAA